VESGRSRDAHAGPSECPLEAARIGDHQPVLVVRQNGVEVATAYAGYPRYVSVSATALAALAADDVADRRPVRFKVRRAICRRAEAGRCSPALVRFAISAFALWNSAGELGCRRHRLHWPGTAGT